MNKVFATASIIAALVISGCVAAAQNLSISDRKLEKEAKRQAKVLINEGWKTAPGHPSIDLQQLRASKLNNSFDDEFNPKFVFGSAQAVGPSYDAAKYQATELAKIDIAGKISSELAGIAKTNIGNVQTDPGQAAAIASTIGAYKNFIATKLTNIIAVIDMYKKEPKGNTTVSIGLFYNKQEAVRVAMQAVREQIKQESEELSKELDNLLGLSE